MNYNISLPPPLAKIVAREMQRRKFSNRSEFFRDLLRRIYVDQVETIERVEAGDPDHALGVARVNAWKRQGSPVQSLRDVRRSLGTKRV